MTKRHCGIPSGIGPMPRMATLRSALPGPTIVRMGVRSPHDVHQHAVETPRDVDRTKLRNKAICPMAGAPIGPQPRTKYSKRNENDPEISGAVRYASRFTLMHLAVDLIRATLGS